VGWVAGSWAAGGDGLLLHARLFPKTPDELAQWQRVLEFQQALPEQQLWWPYATVASFERLLREHLTAWLLSRVPAPQRRGRALPSAGGSQSPFPMPSLLSAGVRDTFVGRDADLQALSDVYDRAARGSRRLMLLCGGPGIGKTRLASQFAVRAHEDGGIVLYGRCVEEGLLAQQPFVEALRHYFWGCSPQELAERSRLVAGELQRIVPELARRIPDLPAPLEGEPEGARSRLFEAVCSLLCEAAQSTPVLLVLDDLHWADKATLLLLKYLVRYPREARLMVLGTYRETELHVDHPLSAMLAELGREHLFERHALAPLDRAAVSELVNVHAGNQASAELGQIIYQGTEGNAFFVVKVLRDLADTGAIDAVVAHPPPGTEAGPLVVPESVKDVVGQRIARLGHETNRLLVMASVLGREFEVDVLQRLSELGEDELMDRLESALRARVIEEVAGSAGCHTFSHALIRDTLYGGLTAMRRALLHGRAGAALEQAHAADLELYFAELAHHFAQAGSRGHLDKAIEYGSRAGERAITQLAYEQAAAHFRHTAGLVDATGLARLHGQRCDLVIAQGEAERQAGDPRYRRTLLDAARSALELHDRDRLARAALANNRGVISSAQGVDGDRVSVLHAALDAYESTDSPTRAALLALLASELVMDDDWRVRDELSHDAIAMARRVDDPRTLAHVLIQCYWTQPLAQRQANLQEAGELADRLNDRLLAAHGALLGAQAAMDAGDVEQCDRLLARLSALAEQLGQPLMRWYDLVARAKRCSIGGPTEDAERLAFDALQAGRIAEQPDSMVWFVGQLFVARFLHGSLDRDDPHLPELLETPGFSLPTSPEITPSRSLPLLLRAMCCATLCEVDRPDDARRHFELLMDKELEELPPDYTSLMVPACASVACAQLGDRRSAARLHTMLEPHSHLLVNAAPCWLGATTHYLGLLAATLERLDEADARFAAAERSYDSLGARPWLARLHGDWAAALLSRRRDDDERRAEQHLERAAAYRRSTQASDEPDAGHQR
jgi:hypothetical protein